MSEAEKTAEATPESAVVETEQEEQTVSETGTASEAVTEVLELVKKMTALELAELVKALEEAFGVSAAAPVAMAAPMGGAGAEAEVEEKTSFDVVLSDIGSKKIQVIKVVRAVTDLGLKEAKELVDKGTGAVVKSGIGKEEAEELKKQLEEAGATVELK